VRPVLEALRVPGFKIPQWERPYDGAPNLTPGAEYQRLSLATYATHDHPPVRTFWNSWAAQAQAGDAHAREEMRALVAFCGEKLESARPFDAEIHAVTMRGLMACNSWLAIPMITDILGTEDRFNVPGAIGDENWTARLGLEVSQLDGEFSTELNVLRQILAQTERLSK
jgi:4-alpha-glucanotransferase